MWYNSRRVAIIPAHEAYSAEPQNMLRIRAEPYYGRDSGHGIISRKVSKITSRMGECSMDQYTPPFEITNKMLSLVSSISEKIGNIDYQNNLQSKPHLRRNNKIRSIHSSLRIEANSLSLSQVRDVIDGHLVLGEQKEIQEVKNAYEAYERISTIDPYSIKDLNALHAVMTKYLVTESGVFRSGEEGVFNGDTCIFMAPPARLVPELMAQLFDWMNRAKDDLHPLILSAVFHYEFVFIHPYSDGNGRMARLWHTALLAKWKPYLNLSPLKVRLKNSKMDIMTRLRSVINMEIQMCLLNLCWNKLIMFWNSSSFR